MQPAERGRDPDPGKGAGKKLGQSENKRETKQQISREGERQRDGRKEQHPRNLSDCIPALCPRQLKPRPQVAEQANQQLSEMTGKTGVSGRGLGHASVFACAHGRIRGLQKASETRAGGLSLITKARKCLPFFSEGGSTSPEAARKNLRTQGQIGVACGRSAATPIGTGRPSGSALTLLSRHQAH